MANCNRSVKKNTKNERMHDSTSYKKHCVLKNEWTQLLLPNKITHCVKKLAIAIGVLKNTLTIQKVDS